MSAAFSLQHTEARYRGYKQKNSSSWNDKSNNFISDPIQNNHL